MKSEAGANQFMNYDNISILPFARIREWRDGEL